ncbi:thiol-disulfide isomerase/thioredoxin [Pontibacter mucosus]|uniref:Thiol-disulfide isomerase/thioredoxin n=1 Tax=Pontibacter mucosus TaxID=1649266 RepID=A0A2T5YHM7_9BACT|nr:thioredoxin family protein [Pontibacter mucosus]PTX18812.1 thiol-disulfide isomerase/thioredoxin [Pontibacter mucosus]
MAQQSIQTVLGSKAHNFALVDMVSDKIVTLQDVASPKATVIMFICNHCPYVKHILPTLVQLAAEYKSEGVNFAAINANDVAVSPEDGPEQMKQLVREMQFPFPYLNDQTQQIARNYQAECTPEFFVYDGSLRLAYHGQFDGSRPSNDTPVTGEDLRQALDALLEGKPVAEEQLPSIGCGIKWRALNPA